MGWDVSGTVEETAPGAVRFKKGDSIFSRPDIMRDGTYAEYVIIKESELALKPESMDHVHAAAIPLAGTTAWQVLFDAAALLPGQKVLIHAAAGGVGQLRGTTGEMERRLRDRHGIGTQPRIPA